MMQEKMLELVPRKLRQLEKEYGIRILYAAESGSRAWGTHTPTSDFDVRFIYIRPREDYLKLDSLRDVLEFPIEEGWDMCGWDIRKLLQLLHKSNTQIYEWFSSPVVYLDDGFSRRFQPVLDAYFSTRTAVYHYLHQAQLKIRKQQKAGDQVKVKHYLYAVQHLAAAGWVLEHGRSVPVSFAQLLPCLPPPIRQEAEALLQKKAEAVFMDPVPLLDSWQETADAAIRASLESLPREAEKTWETLDRFFLAELELSK